GEDRGKAARRLIRKGYEVCMAFDGEQAVEMAASQNPDLILMDMSLPGLDGWEATRQIKAAAATRTLPVIAVTAHPMSDDRERALDSGYDDYDTKPIDFPRLLEKMSAALDRRST